MKEEAYIKSLEGYIEEWKKIAAHFEKLYIESSKINKQLFTDIKALMKSHA